MRAGAYALSLLSVPLNVHALLALTQEPRALIDLRRAIGSPPQTTMRGHLRALTAAGIAERRRQAAFPGSVDYELTARGRELLEVAAILKVWLARSPDGPLELGTPAAKSNVKALVEGWSSAVIRALAAKPLALTELSRLISGLSYPSLERRLGAMRLAGQIEHCPGNGRGNPYAVTDWLRHAVAPLTAAARWERKHVPEVSAPIRRIDIEAVFLLALPLVDLPGRESGICRLAVETRAADGGARLVGVRAMLEEGRLTSCVARLEGEAHGWAAGSAADWLRAIIDGDLSGLELRGDCAPPLVEALNHALFAVRQAV